MKRGEVYWVNFNPSIEEEIQKVRPAIIVSNNSANRYLNRVQVVPLTSNTNKVYPGEVLVTVDGKTGKALANQLSTVSKMRLRTHFDTLNKSDLIKVEQAIKIQLSL